MHVDIQKCDFPMAGRHFRPFDMKLAVLVQVPNPW